MYRSVNVPNCCFILKGKKGLKFGFFSSQSYIKLPNKMISSFCSPLEQHRTRHKLPQVSGWAPRKWRAAVAGTAGCVTPGLHWQNDPGATVTHYTPRRSLALALKAKIKLSEALSVLLNCTGLGSRPDCWPSGRLVISCELTPWSRLEMSPLLSLREHRDAVDAVSEGTPGSAASVLQASRMLSSMPCSCSTVPGVPSRKKSPSWSAILVIQRQRQQWQSQNVTFISQACGSILQGPWESQSLVICSWKGYACLSQRTREQVLQLI